MTSRLNPSSSRLAELTRAGGSLKGLASLISLLLASISAFGQARYLPRYQEPVWFPTPTISELSVGAYGEGIFDQTTFKNSDTTVSSDHVFIGPSIGLVGTGFIYHPNLLSYYLNGEGAFGWSRDSFSDSGSGLNSRDGFDALGRFAFSADILPNKPYRANGYANYDHTFRDYDFFTRVMIDSFRYGGRVTWELEKGLTLGLDYAHRDEDSTSVLPLTQTVIVTNIVNGTNAITIHTNHSSIDQTVRSHDDTLTFFARHERSSGGTVFNYSWDRYSRADLGGVGEGNDHSVSLGDNERFGEQDKYKLNSSLSYFRRDSSGEQSDELIGNANFTAEHRPKLTSYYDLNYDQFSTGDFDSQSYGGQASVRHQLYDSLVSTLTLRGSDFSTSDPNTSTDTRRYGGGFGEFYTKWLTDEHRLRLGNSLFVDHTDQEVNASTVVAIKNEHHTFSEGPIPDQFVLGLINVVPGSIQITDQNDTQPPFLANLDYTIIVNGVRTIIERLPGSRIGTNQLVLVDYAAQPTPSGNYNTMSEYFELRFEFWKNLLGVYGRIGLSLNDAAPELHVQTVHSYAVGTDLNWHWLRAGAEYLIYDATESHYRSARLFQSLVFRPDQASTLSFDFSETWIDYLDAHRQEEQFQFITRFHRALTHQLALDVDAGVSYRIGNGVDQTLATFRPAVKYVVGRTTLDAGFYYEYELFLNNEERHKETFFIRLKRFL